MAHYYTDREDDDKLIARAMSAYYRRGFIDQPSNKGTGYYEVNGKGYIVLDVGSRPEKKVVYRVRNDGMLKFLKRWPPELDSRV